MKSSMFKEGSDTISAKRVVGVFVVLVLCIIAMIEAFSDAGCPEFIVDALTFIAIGALGFTSVERIFSKGSKFGAPSGDKSDKEVNKENTDKL